jgi:hypothetical protein
MRCDVNIKEIKERVSGISHFFDKETMKFFGQKLSDFDVSKTLLDGETCYFITAPIIKDKKIIGRTNRIFRPSTNELFIPSSIGAQ